MSILIAIEPVNGTLNKGSFELTSYAKMLATKTGQEVNALVLGSSNNTSQLGKYGADKVYTIENANLDVFDSQVYATVIAEAAGKLGCSTVLVRHTANGKAILGRLAVKLKADSVSGVNSVPDTQAGFTVTKSVYSGKAIATFALSTENKVLSLMGNAVQPQELGTDVTPQVLDITVPSPRLTLVNRQTDTGHVPLPEAEKVVSAGRGMKGPENWGIVEDLATALGATTACSRPVADTGWRPHHEHVGQTGVAIRPNLYIAIGISGAIQHLAGVNNSKTIVVINKDPEAPFFKAADYGVLGDLFEVVPKLTEAIKRFKEKA
ncbi:MAG: electron transfer flavoprotein subunit alpha/FixB family protein [Saprospiraceae bacterium]|nr:electron transfer flavoprotein subunit alpha/FixB family protein [Saprospiraceae bacterium]